MKVDKLKINGYGRIKDREIQLVDGLNVIKGYNEAGKSTMLSFLTSMLYGIEKNKRSASISDLNKYAPWNSEEFSGTINYTLDNGNKYEVFRDFKKRIPKIYDENKNDITSEFKKNRRGVEFFEEQVGIDKETFMNTGLSFQKLVILDDKDKSNVIQKMANLVSTGEENVSYNNILKKLNQRQIEEVGTSRTKNRPINILDEELSKLHKEELEISEVQDKKADIYVKRLEAQNEFSLLERKRKLLNELKEIYIKEGTEKHTNLQIYNRRKEMQDDIFSKKQEKEDTITKPKTDKRLKIGVIVTLIITIIAVMSLIAFNGYKEITDKNISIKEKGIKESIVQIAPNVFSRNNIIIILSIVIVFLVLSITAIVYAKIKSRKLMEKLEEKNRNIEKDVLELRKEIFELEKELEKEEVKNNEYIKNIKEKIIDKYREELGE